MHQTTFVVQQADVVARSGAAYRLRPRTLAGSMGRLRSTPPPLGLRRGGPPLGLGRGRRRDGGLRRRGRVRRGGGVRGRGAGRAASVAPCG
jgi:hypothetical protein